MQHKDFGHIDGPIALFGGAYSNLNALEAFFAVTDGLDFVFTGDLVGYCADPVATIAAYGKKGVTGGIAGNCERQIVEGAGDCGCGFDEGSACDLLSGAWYTYLRRAVTPDAVEALAKLPDIGSFHHRGRRFAVIHGGRTAINRFIWPSSDESVFRDEIRAVEAAIGPVDAIVAGHSGIAFQRMIGAHHWINAGAIGLPPHDGRPLTRYGILEEGQVVFHRLSYPYEQARARMEDEGLAQGYDTALATGIWPSEDVLPPELRR